MCIIIGKYFQDYGWVGIKNRDRNYVPDISFKHAHANGMEILYFHDDVTRYMEGMNSNGIAVLSASLMVTDDEKEIKSKSKRPSLDGAKIKKALTYTKLTRVAASLIKQKLTGHTIIFDSDTLFLLEGAWRKGEYKSNGFEYKIREISHDDVVVRTNHGVAIEWAGYQHRDDDNEQSASRISSECRKLISERVVKKAETPMDIINGLTKDYTGNVQLNPLRIETETKKMRTTSQTMMIPSEATMFVRPVQSSVDYDFWTLNQPDTKLWVEILSNRVLHQNVVKHRNTTYDPASDNQEF